MNVRLKAKKLPSYKGRRLIAGDEFTASRADARLLLAVKLAELVPEPESTKRPYKTRRLAAEE